MHIMKTKWRQKVFARSSPSESFNVSSSTSQVETIHFTILKEETKKKICKCYRVHISMCIHVNFPAIDTCIYIYGCLPAQNPISYFQVSIGIQCKKPGLVVFGLRVLHWNIPLTSNDPSFRQVPANNPQTSTSSQVKTLVTILNELQWIS